MWPPLRSALGSRSRGVATPGSGQGSSIGVLARRGTAPTRSPCRDTLGWWPRNPGPGLALGRPHPAVDRPQPGRRHGRRPRGNRGNPMRVANRRKRADADHACSTLPIFATGNDVSAPGCGWLRGQGRRQPEAVPAGRRVLWDGSPESDGASVSRVHLVSLVDLWCGQLEWCHTGAHGHRR